MDPRRYAPEFRAFMDRFYWECFHVGREILQALAVGLGLDDKDHLLRNIRGITTSFAFFIIPPYRPIS